MPVFGSGNLPDGGITKITALRTFHDQLLLHSTLPPWLALAIATVLPWLELTCGFCFLTGRAAREAAVVGAMLVLAFTLYLLFQPPETDCGCLVFPVVLTPRFYFPFLIRTQRPGVPLLPAWLAVINDLVERSTGNGSQVAERVPPCRRQNEPVAPVQRACIQAGADDAQPDGEPATRRPIIVGVLATEIRRDTRYEEYCATELSRGHMVRDAQLQPGAETAVPRKQRTACPLSSADFHRDSGVRLTSEGSPVVRD